MFILNLIDQEGSTIPYHISCFPDGEKRLELNLQTTIYMVRIITRIASPEDLFLLQQACKTLSEHRIGYEILISYLMSQRNDRIMVEGSTCNLEIVLEALNDLKANNIGILEIHNPDSLNKYDNIRNIFLDKGEFEKDIMVFPDEGARKRYSNIYSPFIVKKTRTEEGGVISKIEQYPKELKEQRITVIDDLCDGGKTFINLAKQLRELYPEAELTLFVTHAVNGTGLKLVQDEYDFVYFTNSFPKSKRGYEAPIDVIPFLEKYKFY